MCLCSPYQIWTDDPLFVIQMLSQTELKDYMFCSPGKNRTSIFWLKVRSSGHWATRDCVKTKIPKLWWLRDLWVSFMLLLYTVRYRNPGADFSIAPTIPAMRTMCNIVIKVSRMRFDTHTVLVSPSWPTKPESNGNVSDLYPAISVCLSPPTIQR